MLLPFFFFFWLTILFLLMQLAHKGISFVLFPFPYNPEIVVF